MTLLERLKALDEPSDQKNLIRYDEVRLGDELWISTAKAKKGEWVSVIQIKDYWTKTNQHLYRILFDNADIHYGWHDRTFKIK